MTTVHTLASGSSGNAALLSCGETHLLVDAGISCRRITAALRELGLTASDLTAILITHTHTDHIAGLQTLLKHTDCPILSCERVCRELDYRLAGICDRLSPLAHCAPFRVGGCTVTPFPTSHDAPGSCGFRFDTEDGGVGFLTDTGFVTEDAADILPGVELMVLEANHDVEAVRSGSYPYYLKQRILGTEGHLCNDSAARFAVSLAESGAETLVLAHLSLENNTPAMARGAVERALSAAGLSPAIHVAPRNELSAAYSLSGRNVCRK